MLKDGASAVYGSDAVAGVVNIITRQDFQGAELGLSGGTSDQGGMDTQRAKFVGGIGDLDSDGYNILSASTPTTATVSIRTSAH